MAAYVMACQWLLYKSPICIDLDIKTVTFLNEYFHFCVLDEAIAAILELSHKYLHHVAMNAISLALEKGSSSVDLVVRLLNTLFAEKIFNLRI